MKNSLKTCRSHLSAPSSLLGRLAGYAKGLHTLVSQEIKPKDPARETSKRNSQENQPIERDEKNREKPAMKSSQRRTVKKIGKTRQGARPGQKCRLKRE
jgi:hypothetical protein